MPLSGNSQDHFSFFKQKILNKEPFCVIRPNDGEYLVMTNNNFSNIDHWHYDGKGVLSRDLKNAIQKMKILDNSFIGIPCKDCNQTIYNWYIDNFAIPSNTLTYGNIFCNKNWKSFMKLFLENKIPFYYIGPYRMNPFNLNIIDYFETPEFLVNSWDSDRKEFVHNLVEWVKDKKGIFLFSVGPISKVVIPILFELNSSNTYLDVGSTLDFFIKGQSNRGYINDNGDYANIICSFIYGHI